MCRHRYYPRKKIGNESQMPPKNIPFKNVAVTNNLFLISDFKSIIYKLTNHI